MASRVEVTGLKELQARLLALPKEIGDKPLKAALRKVGRVVQASAKNRVRRRTGALADNIIVARMRGLPKGEEAVQVTIRAKARKYKDTKANRRKGRVGGEYADVGPLFYARFLEFGTSQMRAYPFLRPAFEMHKAALPEIFRRELFLAIEAAVLKMQRIR